MITKTMRLTDEELLSEVRAHSGAGAEALYNRYAKALLLAIIRKLHNVNAANNVLCNTYKCAWDTIESYREDDCTLLAWMMKIARKQALIRYESNLLL